MRLLISPDAHGVRDDTLHATLSTGGPPRPVTSSQEFRQPLLPGRYDTIRPDIAILTGGGDRPYALGLASALIAAGIAFDFIGSDELETPDLLDSPRVRFLNLRGDQNPQTSSLMKIARLARYYARLLRYAATTHARVFHILWNNKVDWFDRTALLLYYRLLGKRLAFTVHNVNIRARDDNDTSFNRLTLRIQYRLVDYLFVHTPRMKRELEKFGVSGSKITVIPFGINNTVPVTGITRAAARERLGVPEHARTLLFFGNIAPYKGLEYLVEAFEWLAQLMPDCRLVIAGRPKGSESYWGDIEQRIAARGLQDRIVRNIEYVRDEDTEIYFKAGDVLVLPYVHVFQSGVLFLAYNFGLPVIVSDVGSLKDDIVEGETGFTCPPRDPAALARTIEQYFGSSLYANLDAMRERIRRYAHERHSWELVGDITNRVYASLLQR